MTKPDLTGFYACFQASLAAQQPKPKRQPKAVRPDRAMPPPLLLIDDYTDAVCLLHQLTDSYPTYREILVDADDFELLAESRWALADVGRSVQTRVVSREGKRLLHRVVMPTPRGMVVDHVYRNPLDNRKKKLRVCTTAQNNLNRGPRLKQTSRYRGVCWQKAIGKWVVNCGKRGQPRFYGAFDDEAEAARAYNEYAKENHGEYAYLNPV